MIDHFLRDLQVLRKADFVIAKIWLNVLLRRFGLVAFAALIATFGCKRRRQNPSLERPGVPVAPD